MSAEELFATFVRHLRSDRLLEVEDAPFHCESEVVCVPVDPDASVEDQAAAQKFLVGLPRSVIKPIALHALRLRNLSMPPQPGLDTTATTTTTTTFDDANTALLMLNPEYSPAWAEKRRSVLHQLQAGGAPGLLEHFVKAQLRFNGLALLKVPKSHEGWKFRRWLVHVGAGRNAEEAPPGRQQGGLDLIQQRPLPVVERSNARAGVLEAPGSSSGQPSENEESQASGTNRKLQGPGSDSSVMSSAAATIAKCFTPGVSFEDEVRLALACCERHQRNYYAWQHLLELHRECVVALGSAKRHHQQQQQQQDSSASARTSAERQQQDAQSGVDAPRSDTTRQQDQRQSCEPDSAPPADRAEGDSKDQSRAYPTQSGANRQQVPPQNPVPGCERDSAEREQPGRQGVQSWAKAGMNRQEAQPQNSFPGCEPDGTQPADGTEGEQPERQLDAWLLRSLDRMLAWQSLRPSDHSSMVFCQNLVDFALRRGGSDLRPGTVDAVFCRQLAVVRDLMQHRPGHEALWAHLRWLAATAERQRLPFDAGGEVVRAFEVFSGETGADFTSREQRFWAARFCLWALRNLSSVSCLPEDQRSVIVERCSAVSYSDRGC